MEKQSVRIGVDRFFYAKLLSDDSIGAEYAPSVHLPGVSEVGMGLNSSIGAFYADDGVFETYSVDGEKYLQVSFSGISNEIAAELTGSSYTSANGLLVDKKNDTPPYVAVGFRAQKSNGEYRYVWIYKGRFAKSDSYSVTKSGNVSPQKDVYIYKAALRVYDGAWRQMLDSDDANLPAGMTADTLNSETTGWFSNPNFVPSLP